MPSVGMPVEPFDGIVRVIFGAFGLPPVVPPVVPPVLELERLPEVESLLLPQPAIASARAAKPTRRTKDTVMLPPL
jgi:hypothetical protein